MEPTTEDTQYRRRPLRRVSHRKYKEAIGALKAACGSEKLSLTKRLRAVELLCLIYGLEIGKPNAHDRKSVKRLVSEDAFERELRINIREGTLSQVAREAKQGAERFLAEQAVQEAQTERTERERLAEAFSFLQSGPTTPVRVGN